MLKYTTYIVLLIFFHSLNSFCQDFNYWHKKYTLESTSEKVYAAQKLEEIYVSENRDSLRNLGEDLFFYGINEHYYPAIETGKLILAEYYVQTGKPIQGISTAKALLGAMKERNDFTQISIASKIISQGYRVQNDANSAFYWAQRAVENSEKSQSPETRTYGLISLAEAFLMKKKSKEAIATYEKYIRLAKPLNNQRGLSSAYARLGDIYRIQGSISVAKKYFLLQLKTAKRANLTTPLGHAYNNLAIIYFEEGDTTAARNEFIKALKLRIQSNDTRAISESYYNLGDYHFYINQLDKAQFWYRKSLDYSKQQHLLVEQKDAYKAMVEVAKSTGDFELAIGYLENVIRIEGEIQRENMGDDEELAKLQKQFMELELQAAQEGFSEKTWYTNLRWEWFVILILLIALVGVVNRKRTTN